MININNFMSKRYIGVAFIVRYIHRYREMHVFLVYKVHKGKLENQISRDFILLLFYHIVRLVSFLRLRSKKFIGLSVRGNIVRGSAFHST